MAKKKKAGRPRKEPTKVIRVPESKEPMHIGIRDLGIEAWCNNMTEQGICFLCGKKFNAIKNPCTCGTKTCKS